MVSGVSLAAPQYSDNKGNPAVNRLSIEHDEEQAGAWRSGMQCFQYPNFYFCSFCSVREHQFKTATDTQTGSITFVSWTDGTSNVFLHNSALEPLPTEEILKVRLFPESNGTIFFFTETLEWFLPDGLGSFRSCYRYIDRGIHGGREMWYNVLHPQNWRHNGSNAVSSWFLFSTCFFPLWWILFITGHWFEHIKRF